jgi:hypothetical protein
LKSRFSGRYAVVCALILALGIPSVAVGFGEGRNLVLGKRNPSANSGLGLSSETQIIADNSSYGTRQSNKKVGDGGGAIYGCRSAVGREPCIRSNNLQGGRAFEFVSKGKEAGRIETGDPTGAPFTTNATGVATGLNADRVDGKEAADFAPATALAFAAVSDDGTTVAATGRGVKTATVSGTGPFAYAVAFDRDVSKCSFTAQALGTPQALGVTVPTAAAAGTATVTATTRTAFHLQVIC